MSAYFGIIESIKNNRLCSNKYVPTRKKGPNNNHLIIFSNFLPKFKEMSLDRWIILELQKIDQDNNIITCPNKYRKLKNLLKKENKSIDINLKEWSDDDIDRHINPQNYDTNNYTNNYTNNLDD